MERERELRFLFFVPLRILNPTTTRRESRVGGLRWWCWWWWWWHRCEWSKWNDWAFVENMIPWFQWDRNWWGWGGKSASDSIELIYVFFSLVFSCWDESEISICKSCSNDCKKTWRRLSKQSSNRSQVIHPVRICRNRLRNLSHRIRVHSHSAEQSLNVVRGDRLGEEAEWCVSQRNIYARCQGAQTDGDCTSLVCSKLPLASQDIAALLQ